MLKFKKVLNFLARHKYITTLVVFAVIIAYLDPNSLYNRYIWYREECSLQSQIDEYSSQYQRDTKLYKELQRDPNAVIRIAREKYYMKNENEDVYIFEDEKAK